MDEIKIDKGVPIPSGYYSKRATWFRALAAMEVGDSFAVPIDQLANARTAAGQWSRRSTDKQRKFTVRIVSETEGRLWRVR